VTDLSHITAAILAGGPGTRLASVVSDRPKSLALVRGRPFLAWVLDQLGGAGIREVVLCTGYMADVMEKTLGGSHGPVRMRYSRESSPLGTAGAVRFALPMLNSDPVLVLNGDSYWDVDLPAMLEFHNRHLSPATLLLSRVPDISRFGHVEFDESHRITRYAEKSISPAQAAPAIPGWINAGVYLLSRGFIETIPQGRAVSMEREIFPPAVRDGLYAFCSSGRFIDIGTPDSYRDADSFFIAMSPLMGPS
jgi:NDP-sugar pyrophosphorylase family protein